MHYRSSGNARHCKTRFQGFYHKCVARDALTLFNLIIEVNDVSMVILKKVIEQDMPTVQGIKVDCEGAHY